MSNWNEVLGSLQPLYEEYRGIVDNAPEGVVWAPYNPEVAKDKKADFVEVPIVDLLLLNAGFVGNVEGLFRRHDADEKEGKTEIAEDIITLLGVLKAIPVEKQKKVRVLADGYYEGGIFVRLDREQS